MRKRSCVVQSEEIRSILDVGEFDAAIKLFRKYRDEAKQNFDEAKRIFEHHEKTLQRLEADKKRAVVSQPSWKKRAGGLLTRWESEALTNSSEFPIEKIKELSQARAMVVIAKHYGGILRVSDLQRILLESGLMKATPNAPNIVGRLIRDSERFERISQGLYRLKGFSSDSGPEVVRLQPSPHLQ